VTLVLDASAVVKWFAREDGSEAALMLLSGGEAFLAPDILPLEVAATLLRKERAGLVLEGTAMRALAELETLGIELLPMAPRLRRATELSMQHRHALFDCLYLCVALERLAGIATFDRPIATLATRLSIPLWATQDPAA
jgi:predicted nucleic acid-binding protein